MEILVVLGDLWTRLVFAVKNGALLILTFPTFPSHILFNQFVWSYTKQKDTAPLPTLPLNPPTLIITDVIKVKL